MPGCNSSIVDNACCPDDTCWPSDEKISEFAKSLQGSLYRPSDSNYVSVNTWKNFIYHRKPNIIVMVTGVDDVRKSLSFARRYNILVTIKSTGHSYNGRSTRDGSLQINMKNMKGRRLNLNSDRNPAGEITVETGNTWGDIYKEVEQNDRIIVGGAEQTVSPGGYTQGGGHSPIARSLGLAVDNLLEAHLVTVNGDLVTARENETIVTHSNGSTETVLDGDLLWAIRGGGGGVWGVIINFTFRLHSKPPQVVVSNHYFSFIQSGAVPGRQTLKDLFRIIQRLPSRWGGYLIFNNEKSKDIPNAWGYVQLALNHFGPWNLSSRAAVDEVVNLTPLQLKDIKNKTSYWEFGQGAGAQAPSKVRLYLAGSFLLNDSAKFDKWVDAMVDRMTDIRVPYTSGCVGTMIGGKASQENAHTSVSARFRTGLFCMSCYTAWLDPRMDAIGIAAGHKLNEELLKYGQGVYYNEPSYDLPNWKELFWGGNYDRLLTIKRRWDPDNFLWCYHCIGSDIQNTGSAPAKCSVGGAVIQSAGWLTVATLSLIVIILRQSD
ncbi:FAD-linked oxidoreductase apf9-like [Gigantopelta aegis]|uniref:FAD-linked oxidoreductase apf9-like n=1 Tax=Gigantopelta aegis TaxID=1735272 RepID=UPI001B889477|nr:FAD-linked oxidoreductase apf9-like [Gigantopelta aegis]